MFGSWADGYEDSFVGTFAKNVSPERWEVMNFGVTALPTKRYFVGSMCWNSLPATSSSSCSRETIFETPIYDHGSSIETI